jgi:hypothetical protein
MWATEAQHLELVQNYTMLLRTESYSASGVAAVKRRRPWSQFHILEHEATQTRSNWWPESNERPIRPGNGGCWDVSGRCYHRTSPQESGRCYNSLLLSVAGCWSGIFFERTWRTSLTNSKALESNPRLDNITIAFYTRQSKDSIFFNIKRVKRVNVPCKMDAGCT